MIVKNGHFDTPSDLTGPDSLFGREAPLVLEVGFGDGQFLSHLGRMHPEWNLLGAEISLGSVWRTYRRMKRDGIEHVRLYKGNAGFIVRDVVAKGALSRVYVNFPDPWPRKKQWKNRLLQPDFFRTLQSRLAAGGRLELTTDHPGYFEYALEAAARSTCFTTEQGTPPEAALQTKYARKWLDQGKPIFHARFHPDPIPAATSSVPTPVRAAAPGGAAARYDAPLLLKIPMQHALLSGRLPAHLTFEKQVQAFSGGHVIILEVFRKITASGTGPPNENDQDSLLFKVVTEEPDLRQELLIQAWQRDEDAVHVSLQGFGEPLSTPAVREAVRAVTLWLETQGLSVQKAWI